MSSSSEQWATVLRCKIASLEVVADWASLTNYGPVRDNCRIAIAYLQKEIKRLEGIKLHDA